MALYLMVILGTAIGINLLLELDMFLCVFLSTINALLFLLVLPLLGKHCAKVLSISITGLVHSVLYPQTLMLAL